MIAKAFAEIIMNDWLDDCELVKTNIKRRRK